MDQKDPLEKEMATHFSILAWEIPQTEKAGGLQSMGSQKVGHSLETTQQQHHKVHIREFQELNLEVAANKLRYIQR